MQFPSLCTCKTTQICPPIVYIYYASCFPKVVTASNIETDESCDWISNEKWHWIVFICYTYHWKLRLGTLSIEIKNDSELNALNDNDNDFAYNYIVNNVLQNYWHLLKLRILQKIKMWSIYYWFLSLSLIYWFKLYTY